MTQETEERSSVRGWAIVVGICVLVVGWGYLSYRLIPDAPRRWNYGVLSDVPGQSNYSSEGAPAVENAPRQVPMLPEARPLPGALKAKPTSDGSAP